MKRHDAAAADGRASTLDEALDAAPIAPVTIGVLCAAALVMIIDGFDLQAMPMTVPHVARALGLAPATFGPTLSAVLVGMGAGAVLIAPMGDRRGRRPMILAGLAAISLATVMTGFARSLPWFLVWRFATGLALGACLPNVTASVAEFTPRRRRASLLTVTACGASVGGMAAGFLIPPLVAAGGWPAPFLVSGGFTLLLALLLSVALPESPRHFAAQRPDHPGYARIVGRMGLGDPAAFAAPANAPGTVPMLALLAPPYRFATVVFVGIYTVNAFSLYMLSSWLPTVLPQAGFTLAGAARLAGLTQGGGLVGGILIALFLDRGRATAGLFGAYLLVLVMLLAFSVVAPQPATWGTMLVVVGSGIAGAHLALMAVGASFYPAAMLSSAIGLAVAIGRLGAVAGPLAGAALVGAGASPQIFFLALAGPVAFCALAVFLIPAVQRRLV